MESKVRSYSCMIYYRALLTGLVLEEVTPCMEDPRCKIRCSRQVPTSFGRWVTPRLRRMALIDLFSGSRRSRDRRMEASRERNGNTLHDISETGKIIRKTDSVFTSTRMEISMRDFGKETSAMARAPIGGTRQGNSVANIQETGLKIRSTAEALSSTRMRTDTMATGSLECRKERAEWSMLTRTSTKASGTRARGTAMVS